MMPILLSALALALAAVPALLFLRNLALYRTPVAPDGYRPPAISVLIPARNEERSIEVAVTSVLLSGNVDLEVVVLDDHSSDRTAEIVQSIAAADPRVRLETAPGLPAGWCGKQHACANLAMLASHDLLVFMDADVRLAPDALRRMGWFLESSGADLVSGFPLQETGSFSERVVLPLMHFLLLGFLPISRMRKSRAAAFGAGCGQLFLARRDAYDASGGHEAIRDSLHDGLTLPRSFRRAGLATDLFDATHLARCRMYRNAAEVWNGLAKNATEGLGAPRTIIPASLMLLGGQVLPFILLGTYVGTGAGPVATMLAAAAASTAWLPRLLAVRLFQQPLSGALLHPLGIVWLLAVQWYALARQVAGRPARWKGRDYSAAVGERPAGEGKEQARPALTRGS